LVIHATPQILSLSATSSSMSAYCRFAWDQQFFVRYKIADQKAKEHTPEADDGGVQASNSVTGQLLVKVCIHIENTIYSSPA
jgi:cell cycle checkpoint control protein RAD9A